VWAMRSFGAKAQSRVYGPNLMLHLCAMAEQDGRSVFLYGGKPEIVSRLRENLTRKFPNLTIAGTYSPPFRPLTRNEQSQIAATIRHSKADIVFVGLSTPKQEYWMANIRSELPGTILIGVGAAFDFHANAVEQAPAWMQDRGLEWLFRLTREPRRLWKRYLVITPLFLPLWALQRVGILRYAQPER
jgi:N-acetylglucosaminyldiphosphoundecaprenol N-acetyl-beta-D-mannosaminyltransferase